jgi:dTDP-4-dehydrorhamnose 3,5-epimerase
VRFEATPLPGVVLVHAGKQADARGFFARTWCRREFEEAGLSSDLDQVSISWNASRWTLRGVHWQAAPHEEVKLVRVTRGSIRDVALDLRPGSPTFKRWFAVDLDDEGRAALYLPRGVAHGFLTLRDDVEVLYHIAPAYVPEAARGVRWNDPAFGIEWGHEPRFVSERDRGFPDFVG